MTPPVAALATTLALAVAQPEAPPLRGPSIETQQQRTLLAPGMIREFTPIEGRPEIAAANLLDLDESTNNAIRQIENDRVTELTVLLVDRINDIRDITDLITAGHADDANQRLREIWIDLDGEHRRLPLRPALAGVLNHTQLAEVDRLVNEYLAAREHAHGAHDHQAKDELAFQLFQLEIRRAYDASLGNTRRALEAIYDAVDPTQNQRAAIRELVIEHIKATRLQATPQQRRAVMRRIYDTLDEQRRALLFDYMTRAVLPD